MAATLACTLSGSSLPLNLIYSGKTRLHVYHPVQLVGTFGIPIATEETTLCYVETVIVPYVEVIIGSLGVQSNHCALVIFDVFAAHCCNSVLEALTKNYLQLDLLLSVQGMYIHVLGVGTTVQTTCRWWLGNVLGTKNVWKQLQRYTQGRVRDRGVTWFPELVDKRVYIHVHVHV